MRNGRLVVLLTVLMAAMLALSACGKKESVSEAMRNAWSASMDMRSFMFDGSFVIDKLELPPGAMEAPGLPYLDMIRNMSVSVRGAYVREPMQMEMSLKLTLPGDLALSFEVPFILTADKMYVRVPDIPLFPLGDAAGKFVEFDLGELSEAQGGTLPTVDVETQRRLSVDMLNILARHLDEREYFRELKKDEVPGLPADLKADRYVKFGVTNDNSEAFVTALAEHIAPELIDLLLENEAYRTALNIPESELRRAKDEWSASDPESRRKELDELKESLRIHEFSVTGAIKGNHMVYQALKADFEVTDQGETTGVAFTFDIRYDHINEDVTFEHGIPEDPITMEELEQSLYFGSAY